MLWGYAGKEAGNVDEGRTGFRKAVRNSRTGPPFRGMMSIRERGRRLLIGDDPYRQPLDAAEPGYDFAGVRWRPKKSARSSTFRIIRASKGVGRGWRHQRVETVLKPVPRVGARPLRAIVAIGQRQEIEELPGRHQRVDVIFERDVGDPRLGGMGDRSAELVLGHHFVGHGLDHVGPERTFICYPSPEYESSWRANRRPRRRTVP